MDKPVNIISDAAHEFRTYLTSIINYLSVLSEESGAKLNPDEKLYLNRAFVSAQQLSGLVDNLLEMSRMDRGAFKITPPPQPIDLKPTFLKAAENGKLQAAQKNIEFLLNLPQEPLPNIYADTVKISEVINNFIANAITFSKEGSVIEMGSKVLNNEIVVYVTDNGSGIPKEYQPNLFTKFFHAPASEEQGNKGLGLGLFISKAIIDLHKGKIWVQSEDGKGSTFSFSLPVAAT